MLRFGTLVNAAPASAPRRACDDDDGSPNHHVSRFQIRAPSNVAKITLIVTAPGATPLAIAADTLGSKTMNAMKLNSAAHTTAARGESTLVETTVAIELAES